MTSDVAWVCCQLGAREHYAVPRSLHQTGILAELVTDIWIEPGSAMGRLLPGRLRERFHPQLSGAVIKASNEAACLFEACQWVNGPEGWERIVRRNDWFQRRAVQELARLSGRNPGRRFCIFSFSYAACRLFRFAKSRGWATVLGQIDPGSVDERIVSRLHQRHAALAGSREAAPARYWQAWREECRLADKIVVNSSWSREALLEDGVPDQKLCTVPLAYEAPDTASAFRRCYPKMFTAARPLRVLFLGQVSLRKGMAAILDAMQLLRDEPVEFWFVGPLQVERPAWSVSSAQARWLGSVPRGAAARFYQDADVFLFPTLSDGFGLTQLEAQAWRLPVIASRFCGNVVRDGVNGVVLNEVSGVEIAGVIRSLLVDVARLDVFSRNAVTPGAFGIAQLGTQLLQMVNS